MLRSVLYYNLMAQGNAMQAPTLLYSSTEGEREREREREISTSEVSVFVGKKNRFEKEETVLWLPTCMVPCPVELDYTILIVKGFVVAWCVDCCFATTEHKLYGRTWSKGTGTGTGTGTRTVW